MNIQKTRICNKKDILIRIYAILYLKMSNLVYAELHLPRNLNAPIVYIAVHRWPAFMGAFQNIANGASVDFDVR